MVPIAYCNLQDAKHSPFVRFAEGALKGKYNDFEVFTGLVKAMVTKVDKEERGVGMQNFTYAPAWDEFVHIVSIHSPKTHKFLSEHLPARTIRNIRYVVSTAFASRYLTKFYTQ